MDSKVHLFLFLFRQYPLNILPPKIVSDHPLDGNCIPCLVQIVAREYNVWISSGFDTPPAVYRVVEISQVKFQKSISDPENNHSSRGTKSNHCERAIAKRGARSHLVEGRARARLRQERARARLRRERARARLRRERVNLL